MVADLATPAYKLELASAVPSVGMVSFLHCFHCLKSCHEVHACQQMRSYNYLPLPIYNLFLYLVSVFFLDTAKGNFQISSG